MRKAVLAALCFVLVPAPQAQGQSAQEKAYNVGVHKGRIDAIREDCPSLLVVDPQMRQLFRLMQAIDRVNFLAGWLKGSNEVFKVTGDDGARSVNPDGVEALACLVGVITYGPHGSIVPGVLGEDRKARAKLDAQRKTKQRLAKQAAERRKAEPKPEDAAEHDLIVAGADPPDRLTGTWRLRTATYSKDPSITIGCVPCFNVLMQIAVIGGVPYTANGTSHSRFGRYRLVLKGQSVPVRNGEDVQKITTEMIAEIRAIPGCAGPADVSRVAKAITDGICLDR